jgi:hypothetical protein
MPCYGPISVSHNVALSQGEIESIPPREARHSSDGDWSLRIHTYLRVFGNPGSNMSSRICQALEPSQKLVVLVTPVFFLFCFFKYLKRSFSRPNVGWNLKGRHKRRH